MCAKPCIDIDVVIKDYSVFDELVNKLSTIGYIHEGDLGIKDREAFRYSGKEHLMNHHLYVCPLYSEELHRHVTFRDFLKSDAEAVKKYSTVKETAATLTLPTLTGISGTSRRVLKNYTDNAVYPVKNNLT
jgi:GrpB-like predicted nucleotidyltransferase (UPF0157 family)